MSGAGSHPDGPAPPTRLELLSWCLYDFANSAFPTLITTVAYAVYFTQAVAVGSPHASLLWGAAISVSMVISGLISPWVGAIADHQASKKRWLLIFTVMSIVPTALLFFVEPGDIVSGMVLFIVANIGFAAGNGLYNGFLPELSDETNVGRLSGYGYALGYSGGLLALVLCLPLLSGGFGEGHDVAFRGSFLITAAFFAVFSLPTFLWLRARAR